MRTAIRKAALAAAALSAIASPALAHHAMDGKLPTSFMQGLLSGMAHPVIGPDHFAFIIAIGIAAAIVPGGIGVIAAFLAASTLGVLAHLAALDLPMAEALVASSLIVAGGLVTFGRRAGAGPWLALAIFAGLIHGYAFGESIVGADRNVVGAYLIGLACVSGAVAAGIMLFTRAFVAPRKAFEAHLRTAGVVLGSAGVVMLAAGLTG